MIPQVRSHSQDFTVSGTPDEYAPEVFYLRRADQATQPTDVGYLDLVEELQALVVTLPAGAVVEIEVLKPGDAPSGTWRATDRSYTLTGLQTPEAFSRWLGVRIRVKSGGAAGTATVDAHWWGGEVR